LIHLLRITSQASFEQTAAFWHHALAQLSLILCFYARIHTLRYNLYLNTQRMLIMKQHIIGDSVAFAEFASPLMGKQVSRIWQGYGSAIFIELGSLQSRKKRDGQPGSPRGEWSLMIQWSWRVEGKRRIWCGSWSDGERWPRAFARFQGAKVASISLQGRLPEIDLGLDNGLHLVSMMTAEGDPEWALSKRVDGKSTSVRVLAGRLVFDEQLADYTS
jgi:hypothetical protein